MWHSGGRQVVGDLPDGFLAHHRRAACWACRSAAFYVLAVSAGAVAGHRVHAAGPRAVRDRRQPEGGAAQRHLGAQARDGRLRRLGRAVAALPACCWPRKLQIGQASVGLEFLLPALVGAFLGSTTIRPGRVNVWGTLVGVAILAIGISGIQQFGGAFFVEPLFNGLTLLVVDRHRRLGAAAPQRCHQAPHRAAPTRHPRLPRRQRCPTQRTPLPTPERPETT